MIEQLTVETDGQGLYEITADVERLVRRSAADEGLCTVFVRHTSASLTIQENADPSARRDLEAWLIRLVPENDELFTHTSGGECWIWPMITNSKTRTWPWSRL